MLDQNCIIKITPKIAWKLEKSSAEKWKKKKNNNNNNNNNNNKRKNWVEKKNPLTNLVEAMIKKP
jgi:hypothetical protein